MESLRKTGLVGQGGFNEYDRLTELASSVLKVPVCLVSLVDDEKQVFPGACGLPAPMDQERKTPLSHSFCQLAVRTRRPLIIRDASRDARVAGNPAILDLGVMAYLGFPIIGRDFQALGAFCVIDSQPRAWTAGEIRQVRDFTAVVADLIDHRLERERFRTDLDLIIHDLKNPLSGVAMGVSILESRLEGMPEDLVPLVEAMADSSRRASELLGKIARSDRREKESCFDLMVRIEEVVDRHRAIADEKGLELQVEAVNGRQSVAVASWAVVRVVENLLTNAVKFSPRGGVIRVSVERTHDGSHLEISDQGPGFSEADRAKLYRRYARLSAEPTAGEESTGLGLSIVKSLMDQVGGTIELVSEPGEGARFRLVFPKA
nr:HAMP domain-containing sensor histidine kinase [Haloferula luteola]